MCDTHEVTRNAHKKIDDRSKMVVYLGRYWEVLVVWVLYVALSLCEAEFMAARVAACHGVWLGKLLSKITDKKHCTV